MSGPGESEFLSLIERVYDAALDGAKWTLFIRDFAEIYHGAAALFSQHLRSGDTAMIELAAVDSGWISSYITHYSARKPWLSKMDSSDVGAVVTERTLIDRSRYERSEYYNDWVRPQGFYHLLGNILRKEGPVSTTLTVLRPAAEGEFDDIERNFCARLTPHLQRAVQMHRQLSAALVARDAAGQALDGLAVGVILVDRSARVLHANGMAERILGAGDALTVWNGRLGAVRSGAGPSLQALIAAAVDTAGGQGGDAGSVLRLERHDGPSLSVLVYPLRPASGLFRHDAPAALVLVSDPGAAPRISPAALASLHGLTAAEAALLAALLNGQTLAGHAEARGITLATAKTQLQSIFGKTGQSRQPDLIRHILADPIGRFAIGRE